MSSTSTCQLNLKITFIELVGRVRKYEYLKMSGIICLLGRGGKTGTATTLITPNQSEVVLKDLQHLLVEAKQKVPEFLSFATEKLLEEDKELVALTGVRGCAYCGGLGHRIGNTHVFDPTFLFTILK